MASIISTSSSSSLSTSFVNVKLGVDAADNSKRNFVGDFVGVPTSFSPFVDFASFPLFPFGDKDEETFVPEFLKGLRLALSLLNTLPTFVVFPLGGLRGDGLPDRIICGGGFLAVEDLDCLGDSLGIGVTAPLGLG